MEKDYFAYYLMRFRGGVSVRDAIVQTYSTPFPTPKTVFMPPPFEE